MALSRPFKEDRLALPLPLHASLLRVSLPSSLLDSQKCNPVGPAA